MAAALAILAAAVAIVTTGSNGSPPRRPPAAATATPAVPHVDARPPRRPGGRTPPPRRPEPIRWRRSVAVGPPAAGRLVRGVRLPARRATFVTWDPVRRRSPNRAWRRWGTDRLVRLLVAVAREYRAAHPHAPRLAIGDLSRPRGGDFSARYGALGHASHQNGLDADVYYPRLDARERAPRRASQIDRRLSRWLVDRFVARGAEVVFVGPNTRLTGRSARVQVLAQHDNHLHVRLPPSPRR